MTGIGFALLSTVLYDTVFANGFIDERGAMKTKEMFHCMVAVLLLLTAAGTASAVGIGDPFPVFSRPNTLTPEECAQLGIDQGQEFSLTDIRHDVTILEFLNVYCHTCRQQVQIFNELHKVLREDPELSGKACIIGIAVGNTDAEIRDFKKTFGAAYPILPDTKKEIFSLTGNMQGTPHTYILRKEDQRFIIDYHAGGVASHDRYLETVRFALRGTFVGTALGNKVIPYAFLSNGIRKDSSEMAGKPAILYFPVKKTFPVAIDTRNRGNQIKILHDIRRKFPEVTVIAFQSETVKLPKAIAEPSFIIADEPANEPLAAFRSPDNPTVYFVNRYGRISFKGEAITLYNAETILQGREYKPEVQMTDAEIIARIEQRISAAGLQPDGTEKEILDTGKVVFVTALKPRRDGVYLFSILETKPSLCDICHDSHFLYIIDQDGVFKDFIALQLTKLGNIQWTEEDVGKIKQQIVGKSAFGEFPFDPKVDAVTTATMSSGLIYDAFNDAKRVLATYKDHKFRYEHWKSVCFEHICEIKRIAGRMLKEKGQSALSEEVVGAILEANKNLACPHDGSYVVIDNNILCSIHGLHTKPCGK